MSENGFVKKGGSRDCNFGGDFHFHDSQQKANTSPFTSYS